MNTMAAGAVGDIGVTEPPRQTMVASQKCVHHLPGKIIFPVDDNRIMAACTDFLGQTGGIYRGFRVEMAQDHVLAMAIGADRRFPNPFVDCLAMNAFIELLLDILVAVPAGGADMDPVDSGFWITASQNGMITMAILAGGGIGIAAAQKGFPMDTLAVQGAG